MSKPTNFRGPPLVPFDRKALVRRYAKIFYRELSNPGVKNVSFVIERDDAWNIQSSHRDDSDASETFLRAAHLIKGM